MNAMTDRQRFLAQLRYQPRDRCPIMDFEYWAETIPVWHKQGLPADVRPQDFLGLDAQWIGAGLNLGLHPRFEERVLEDRPTTRIILQPDGVIAEVSKGSASIPHFLAWTLTGRSSWREFRDRLDPDTPGRIPDDWEQRCAAWKDRDYPLFISAGSLYGWIRDWMGVENVSYLIHDDPALFEEMVTTLADLFTTVLERALSRAARFGVTFDYASMWEDMCYRAGPLISPQTFAKVLVPNYKRVTAVLRKYGIDIIVVDSDGDGSLLTGLWLEGGVNCHFPIEVGTWGADVYEYRRRWGKDLLMMGGFDKNILARSKDAIRREIERLGPLVEEGGFIPFCDHRVPPNVPFDNYVYYVEQAKAVWGRSLNVKPTGNPAK